MYGGIWQAQKAYDKLLNLLFAVLNVLKANHLQVTLAFSISTNNVFDFSVAPGVNQNYLKLENVIWMYDKQ